VYLDPDDANAARGRDRGFQIGLLLLATLCQTDSAVLRLTPTRYKLTVRIDYGSSGWRAPRGSPCGTSPTPSATSPAPPRLMGSSMAVNGTAVAWTERVVRFSNFPHSSHPRQRHPPALSPGGSVKLELPYDSCLLGYAETGMAYMRTHRPCTILRDDTYAASPRLSSVAVNRRAPFHRTIAWGGSPCRIAGRRDGGRLVERTAAGWATSSTGVKPSWRMDFAIGDYAVIRTDR
jgi:hypothetical protein